MTRKMRVQDGVILTKSRGVLEEGLDRDRKKFGRFTSSIRIQHPVFAVAPENLVGGKEIPAPRVALVRTRDAGGAVHDGILGVKLMGEFVQNHVSSVP